MLVHLGSGAALSIARIPIGPAIAAMAAVEVAEMVLRRGAGGKSTGLLAPETPGNIAMDILAGIAGYYAAERLRA